MNYITIYRETDLLIYKDCKFALIPSRIDRYFLKNLYKLKSNIRI